MIFGWRLRFHWNKWPWPKHGKTLKWKQRLLWCPNGFGVSMSTVIQVLMNNQCSPVELTLTRFHLVIHYIYSAMIAIWNYYYYSFGMGFPKGKPILLSFFYFCSFFLYVCLQSWVFLWHNVWSQEPTPNFLWHPSLYIFVQFNNVLLTRFGRSMIR